ncbi:MAG: hypothetical protein KR126chlam6_01241 [Candidatus Anoxychlamydiales bacterium]|nr:hypothetical protein [Candidatus Anoxychlamydiales bacterium]
MTSKLNPILTQDFSKTLKSNLIKARLLKIASIINFIVICIFATYLITFLGATSAILPTIHLAIGLATPALAFSINKIHIESKKHFNKASFYKDVIEESKKLTDDIATKFLNKIDTPAKTDSFKKIIPAIAYFKAVEKQMNYFLNEIKEIKDTKSKDPKVRYFLQKKAHDIYETKILSLKLELAQIYHIINNPTSQKSLKDFGIIYTLDFAKRIASALDNNDLYFVFYSKIQQKRDLTGLTFTEIDNLEIQDISNLIFNY